MKKTITTFTFYFLTFLLISNSYSKTTSDKNWFCAQRLVHNLSIGAIWRGGNNEVFDKFKNNELLISLKLENTAQNIIINNEDKELAKVTIEKFANLPNSNNEQLTLLFAYTLNELNKQRKNKIDHILRYGDNHQKRVLAIQNTREKIRAAIKKNQTNSLQELEEKYNWQIEIFNSRKKINPYLCQKVVDVDSYAFFIAKEISSYIKQ